MEKETIIEDIIAEQVIARIKNKCFIDKIIEKSIQNVIKEHFDNENSDELISKKINKHIEKFDIKSKVQLLFYDNLRTFIMQLKVEYLKENNNQTG